MNIQRFKGPEYLGDIHHDNSGDGFDGIILLEFQWVIENLELNDWEFRIWPPESQLIRIWNSELNFEWPIWNIPEARTFQEQEAWNDYIC